VVAGEQLCGDGVQHSGGGASMEDKCNSSVPINECRFPVVSIFVIQVV
jgi:hypothetical protein